MDNRIVDLIDVEFEEEGNGDVNLIEDDLKWKSKELVENGEKEIKERKEDIKEMWEEWERFKKVMEGKNEEIEMKIDYVEKGLKNRLKNGDGWGGEVEME